MPSAYAVLFRRSIRGFLERHSGRHQRINAGANSRKQLGVDFRKTFTVSPPKLLGDFRVDEQTAKLALRLLTDGMSIRAAERITGLHRDTICRLVVFYGNACRRFLDRNLRGPA